MSLYIAISWVLKLIAGLGFTLRVSMSSRSTSKMNVLLAMVLISSWNGLTLCELDKGSCDPAKLHDFGTEKENSDPNPTECEKDGESDLEYARDTPVNFNTQSAYDGSSTDLNLGEGNIGVFIDTMMDIAEKLSDKNIRDLDQTINYADMIKEAVTGEKDVLRKSEDSNFEYLPMTRLHPGTVGQIKTIELPDGRKTNIKTLAKRPPLFEIEKFLTDKECDMIIEAGTKAGLKKSKVFVDSAAQQKGEDISITRDSYSGGLEPPHIDIEFLNRILKRISYITDIPLYVIEGSEQIELAHYKPGGYFLAHLDSNVASRTKIPCCHQKVCIDSSGMPHESTDCCTKCRYATFLYYLKDVEGGGETAFPFADMTLTDLLKSQETTEWYNLTSRCHAASVVVKPAKGKALFWYNHLLDKKGYLGGVDPRGYHGGCNVTAGTKWIATNWISSPIYAHRFTRSRFSGDNLMSYKQYLESRV